MTARHLKKYIRMNDGIRIPWAISVYPVQIRHMDRFLKVTEAIVVVAPLFWSLPGSKSFKVKGSKAFKLSKAGQGEASYKLLSVKGKKAGKLKKMFKVDAKTGKITVKKGLKKGTYKLKISVSAAGNDSYEKADKTVKVTVRVR